MDFTGKVAVVAGGGSGIGRATAVELARLGAQVVVADIDEAGAAETCRLAGEGALARVCDVTDLDACRALVEAAAEVDGNVDVLVNAVGWTAISPFLDEDEGYWRRIVDLNLMASIYLSHAALERMTGQGGGAIVLTSSDAGRIGTSGESVYSAAKAGVIGLTKSLAREGARAGVRVNCVAPGPTDTPLLAAQASDDLLAKIRAGIPMRRLARPEEPADAIVFLASERASYITGQTLSVSGGLTMVS